MLRQQDSPIKSEVTKILEEAVQRKDDDRAIYEEAAAHAKDATIRALYEGLAAVEHEQHLLLERRLSEMLAETDKWDPNGDYDKSARCVGAFDSQ